MRILCRERKIHKKSMILIEISSKKWILEPKIRFWGKKGSKFFLHGIRIFDPRYNVRVLLQLVIANYMPFSKFSIFSSQMTSLHSKDPKFIQNRLDQNRDASTKISFKHLAFIGPKAEQKSNVNLNWAAHNFLGNFIKSRAAQLKLIQLLKTPNGEYPIQIGLFGIKNEQKTTQNLLNHSFCLVVYDRKKTQTKNHCKMLYFSTWLT